MCVIICCDKESGFPALQTLESAEALNRHGGSIAWIGVNGKVQWQKGINAKQIFAISKQIPLPAIIHFRIASIGDVNDPLCHPFPINEEASCELSGECDSVLFHNGTWREWSDVCLEAVIKKDIKFPEGEWSDSRAMAWLVDKYGTGILNLLTDGNKVAIFSKEGIKKYGSWVKVKDFSCSNNYFDHSIPAFEFDFGSKSRRTLVDDDEFFHTLDTEDDPITMSNDDDYGTQRPIRSRKQMRKQLKREQKKLKKLKQKLKDPIKVKVSRQDLINHKKKGHSCSSCVTTKLTINNKTKQYPTGLLSAEKKLREKERRLVDRFDHYY